MKGSLKTTEITGTHWGNIRVELERVRREEFRGSGRALDAEGIGLTAAGVDGSKAAPDGYGNEKIGDASSGGIESEGFLVPDGITTVAYAVSLTSCGKAGNDSGPGLTDGAAVLAHSIRSVSYPAVRTSRYSAKLIALVHPDAAKCSGQLERLGYETITVPTPVVVEEIEGKFLREHVNKTGCCGEKEFIKLYAYTLTEYDGQNHHGGFAISLTSCGTHGNQISTGLADGAAVLAHSIRSVSYPTMRTSRYSAKMIAFVHSDAAKCSGHLERLGYESITVPTPFLVEEIQGKFLREHVNKTGCCGEKEFIKLYAYTLTEYDVAVHLDLDFLVLKPMDDLFDVMLAGGNGTKTLLRQKVDGGQVRAHVGPHAELNYMESENRVDAFFTRDYNMIRPGKKHVGVQGGFLILRPSHDAFAEYIKIIKKG
eukprot:CAMPEP_0194299220 /NCGR_PEP_ID=MMETSP0169-20130528/60604_1 /TAXON_ID=218684 /ORGANISM="Corethron pennatum, Strain L29A3" /LENGTH=425 /DNA_ID=CAMNT_0039049301 /DNA_START=131 /DNA_END=1405 /DNA_ORIENTATION=-